MDTITVKISDLWEKVNQMKQDGMDNVTISLFEAEEGIPALMNLTARKKSDDEDWESAADWDYDYIEAI